MAVLHVEGKLLEAGPVEHVAGYRLVDTACRGLSVSTLHVVDP